MLAHLPVTEQTPPLYFGVMFFWTRVAGTSEIALHVPSLVFGLATIGLMYVLGKQIGGRAGALVCAGAATLAPLEMAMHVEARSYALAMFLSALTLIAFSRAMVESGGRLRPADCAAVFACGFLLIATHVTGFVIVAALAICAIVNARFAEMRPPTQWRRARWRQPSPGFRCCCRYGALRRKLPRLRYAHDLGWFGLLSNHLNAFLAVRLDVLSSQRARHRRRCRVAR